MPLIENNQREFNYSRNSFRFDLFLVFSSLDFRALFEKFRIFVESTFLEPVTTGKLFML